MTACLVDGICKIMNRCTLAWTVSKTTLHLHSYLHGDNDLEIMDKAVLEDHSSSIVPDGSVVIIMLSPRIQHTVIHVLT